MLEITPKALTILIQLASATYSNLGSTDIQELYCLASNAFFEARGEAPIGKIAVNQVVKNRVKNKHFPNTYCKVILEGPIRESWKTKKYPKLADSERIYYPSKHRCQFSWYCDGRSDKIRLYNKYSKRHWKNAVATSMLVYFDLDKPLVGNALHYYAHKKVFPSWAKKIKSKTIIGNHTFVEK